MVAGGTEALMTKLIGICALVALTLLGPKARAQTFGHSGDVSFAADRLMGIYLISEDPNDRRRTVLGLGAPPGSHAYTIARLGIDGFVIDRLSLGGSFAYWSNDGPDGFLFAPRIGYALEISNAFGFWPRGGVTYRSFGAGRGRDEELAITIEGMFYASPARHFAFLFGPAFDIGLIGDGGEAVNLGLLTFGILGWI
jgi:hypothetical protein